MHASSYIHQLKAEGNLRDAISFKLAQHAMSQHGFLLGRLSCILFLWCAC